MLQHYVLKITAVSVIICIVIVLSQVRNEFYRDTQGALLVYDVTNRASFEALDDWMAELKSEIGNASELNNIVIVVCANKVPSLLCGWLGYHHHNNE